MLVLLGWFQSVFCLTECFFNLNFCQLYVYPIWCLSHMMFVLQEFCPTLCLIHSLLTNSMFFLKNLYLFSTVVQHGILVNQILKTEVYLNKNWFVVEHILFAQMIKAIKLGLTTIYIADHKMGVHLSTKEEYCWL